MFIVLLAIQFLPDKISKDPRTSYVIWFAVGAEVLQYEQANVTINLKNPNKPSAKDKIVSAALPSLNGIAESTAEAAGTSEPAE